MVLFVHKYIHICTVAFPLYISVVVKPEKNVKLRDIFRLMWAGPAAWLSMWALQAEKRLTLVERVFFQHRVAPAVIKLNTDFFVEILP